MKIKKMPVSVSYSDFIAKSNEFLIPFTGLERKGFRGIESGKSFKYGIIKYIGKEIGVNEVFSKLVESGQKIDNTQDVLSSIGEYIVQLKQFKVGNILSISYSDKGDGFTLVKEASRPKEQPREKSKLP